MVLVQYITGPTTRSTVPHRSTGNGVCRPVPVQCTAAVPPPPLVTRSWALTARHTDRYRRHRYCTSRSTHSGGLPTASPSERAVRPQPGGRPRNAVHSPFSGTASGRPRARPRRRAAPAALNLPIEAPSLSYPPRSRRRSIKVRISKPRRHKERLDQTLITPWSAGSRALQTTGPKKKCPAKRARSS